MKFTITVLVAGMVVLVSAWTNGPGPAISENSFQIQGDGFSNQLIKLGISSNQFEYNYYAKSSYNYFEDYENMTIKISGSNSVSKEYPITGISMDFDQLTKPGKYTMDSAISVSLFFKKNIPTKEIGLHYLLVGDGEVTITKYEPIGGLIEGTFFGTFVKMNYNKITEQSEASNQEVNIQNGKFSVIHYPDYHWDAAPGDGVEPIGFNDKKKKKL